MKLNHLNLAVPTVAPTQELLHTYFGFKTLFGSDGDNPALVVLSDGAGTVLTLMQSSGEVTYPASFHIGFIQESEDEVNALNARLKADGFEVKPPRRFHGSWTFYFRAPGGFLIEVLC